MENQLELEKGLGWMLASGGAERRRYQLLGFVGRTDIAGNSLLHCQNLCFQRTNHWQ